MQAANLSSYSLWSAKFIFWHFYKHHQITGSMVKQSKELCEKNEIGIFLVWVLFLKTVSTWVYTFSLDLDASNQNGPKTTVSQSCLAASDWLVSSIHFHGLVFSRKAIIMLCGSKSLIRYIGFGFRRHPSLPII